MSAFQAMVLAAADKLQAADPSELVAKLIRKQIILTWLLCVQRMMSKACFHANHGGYTEAGRGVIAEATNIVKLPLTAVQLLGQFLGTLKDMGPGIVPARIFKGMALHAQAVQKMKIKSVLSEAFEKHVRPQVMVFVQRGAMKGRIVIPQIVFGQLKEFDDSVRDNISPMKLMEVFLVLSGFRFENPIYVNYNNQQCSYEANKNETEGRVEVTLHWD